MPLDPFTGRYMPYDGSAPADVGGFGTAALDAQPGMFQSALLQSTRGSSTMMYGGYAGAPRMGLKSASRAKMMANATQGVRESDFTRIGRRRLLKAQAKGNALPTPILKPALRNISPRSLLSGQYEDLSVFKGYGSGRYTFSQFFGETLGRSKRVQEALVKGSFTTRAEADAAQAAQKSVLGPGLTSALQASSRADALEKKMVKAIAKGDKRITKKIASKLSRIDDSTDVLLNMNRSSGSILDRSIVKVRPNAVSPAGVAYDPFNLLNSKRYFAPATQIRYGQSGYETAQAARLNMSGVGSIGVRGNLMMSGLSSPTLQRMGGYFRGAGGFGRGIQYEGMNFTVKTGAKMAEKQFMTAAARSGIGTKQARAMLAGTEKIGLRAGSRIAMSGGAKVMAARGLQVGAKFAGPIGWVMLAYDAGKLMGAGVKSGINLAKDAVKSFQGSIYKPAFGMGYKDNEVAATSRARGVMAIQNSRLNARSVLGSEAGMMAAHFG